MKKYLHTLKYPLLPAYNNGYYFHYLYCKSKFCKYNSVIRLNICKVIVWDIQPFQLNETYPGAWKKREKNIFNIHFPYQSQNLGGSVGKHNKHIVNLFAPRFPYDLERREFFSLNLDFFNKLNASIVWNDFSYFWNIFHTQSPLPLAGKLCGTRGIISRTFSQLSRCVVNSSCHYL